MYLLKENKFLEIFNFELYSHKRPSKLKKPPNHLSEKKRTYRKMSHITCRRYDLTKISEGGTFACEFGW